MKKKKDTRTWDDLDVVNKAVFKLGGLEWVRVETRGVWYNTTTGLHLSIETFHDGTVSTVAIGRGIYRFGHYAPTPEDFASTGLKNLLRQAVASKQQDLDHNCKVVHECRDTVNNLWKAIKRGEPTAA